jgi:hypothetical protein
MLVRAWWPFGGCRRSFWFGILAGCRSGMRRSCCCFVMMSVKGRRVISGVILASMVMVFMMGICTNSYAELLLLCYFILR